VTIAELWRRTLYLFRRDRVSEELEEEMRLHTELRVNQLRERDLDSQEALYAAQRQFGNRTLLKEVSREMWDGHRSNDLLKTFATPYACCAKALALRP